MIENETKTEVKKTAAKKADAVTVETATGVVVKASASKKKTAKAAAKPAAKKAAKTSGTAARATVYVQYAEKEIEPKALLEKAKTTWLEDGHDEADFQSIDLYIKPEDNSAYYVINGSDNGCIPL